MTSSIEIAPHRPDPPTMVTIHCPLCGSGDDEVLVVTRDFIHQIDSPSVDGTYRYVRCRSCQHLYLNPRPADDALASCYPKEYGPHQDQDEDERSQAESEPTPATAQAEKSFAEKSVASQSPARKSVARRVLGSLPFLKRFLFWLGQQHATAMPALPVLRADRTPRLLEIGCAYGGFLQSAREHGWTVDGIETNRGAAQRARHRGFEVRTTPLAQSDIPDRSRDAIASWMVLEHVHDPRQTLEHCFRILDDGGWLGISVPDGGGFERRLFGRFWIGYEPPRHLQIFTAKRLRGLLAETGFTDVKITHQASLRYWWGSLAAWGLDRWPQARWPRRLMDDFIGEPPRWIHWLLIVPEKVLSIAHLTGRITVTARKPGTQP